MTPWETSSRAAMIEMGRRMYNTVLVISCQKFPMVREVCLEKPRIKTIAIHIPVAAERKFCTASPDVWVR
jgi:hypothetical protein